MAMKPMVDELEGLCARVEVLKNEMIRRSPPLTCVGYGSSSEVVLDEEVYHNQLPSPKLITIQRGGDPGVIHIGCLQFTLITRAKLFRIAGESLLPRQAT
ncbi:hypothetical protein HAX54_029484 [Datura stramonium]|uniref:Uncharacterized protein n=1 Tax=Datura stramonium TaxID=4076 RepID=A0ABS8V8C6_DATST|nr:hypothetical protein [Datura stramonium]